jgi:hypothetical protein
LKLSSLNDPCPCCAVKAPFRAPQSVPDFRNTMLFPKRADPTPIPLPPKPVVLIPSGTYDGDDGRWSTFNINVAGDGQGKGQNFKVLISTSSPITIVPAQSGWCSTEECANRRGIMDPNSLGLDYTPSNYYKDAGTYQLPVQTLDWWSPSLMLPGFSGNLTGVWALTTVGLGQTSPQSTTLSEQYVAAQDSKDFFLGSLGLSVGVISPQGADKPTFMSSLQSRKQIASHSYGFTAGASYRK